MCQSCAKQGASPTTAPHVGASILPQLRSVLGDQANSYRLHELIKSHKIPVNKEL